MAIAGRSITNQFTGEMLTWLETAADTRGTYLKFRLDVAPLGLVAVPHIHPDQEERFEILAGSMELLVDGHRRMVYAGDTAVVPKGAPHQWWNRSDTDALSMNVTLVPALNTETMFEQVWGRVNDGKGTRDGGPALLDAFVFMKEYHVYLTIAPVGVQRFFSATIGTIAQWFGYRKFRPRYSPEGPVRHTYHKAADHTQSAAMHLRQSTPLLPMRHRILLSSLAAALTIGASAQTQYASTVLAFSTEFQPSNAACSLPWAACKILGEPDVYPFYGDAPLAWASATVSAQREFIVVGFDIPMPITSVNIYETYYPGAIDTVYVRNANTGEWLMVWWGTAAFVPGFQAQVVPRTFPLTPFPVDAVRIAINSPQVVGRNEIDAVSIGNSAVGMEEGAYKAGALQVFPNPSNGRFTLNGGDMFMERMIVRDVAGRVLAERSIQARSTCMSLDLPPGIHLIEVMGPHGVQTTRLVVE